MRPWDNNVREERYRHVRDRAVGFSKDWKPLGWEDREWEMQLHKFGALMPAELREQKKVWKRDQETGNVTMMIESNTRQGKHLTEAWSTSSTAVEQQQHQATWAAHAEFQKAYAQVETLTPRELPFFQGAYMDFANEVQDDMHRLQPRNPQYGGTWTSMSAVDMLSTPAETPRSPRGHTPRGYLLSPRNLPADWTSPRSTASFPWPPASASSSPRGYGLPGDNRGILPELRSVPVEQQLSGARASWGGISVPTSTPPRTPRSALEPARPPLGGTPRGQGHLHGVPAPAKLLLADLEPSKMLWL